MAMQITSLPSEIHTEIIGKLTLRDAKSYSIALENPHFLISYLCPQVEDISDKYRLLYESTAIERHGQSLFLRESSKRIKKFISCFFGRSEFEMMRYQKDFLNKFFPIHKLDEFMGFDADSVTTADLSLMMKNHYSYVLRAILLVENPTQKERILASASADLQTNSRLIALTKPGVELTAQEQFIKDEIHGRAHFETADIQIKNDPYIAKMMCYTQPELFRFCSSELRANKEFCLDILSNLLYCGWNYQFLSEELKRDDEIICTMLKRGAFEDLTDDLKDNPDIVFNAIRLRKSNGRYMSPRLKDNEDFARKAVAENPEYLTFFSDRVQQILQDQ